MTEKRLRKLIDSIKSQTDNKEMVRYVMDMKGEDKFACLCAMMHNLCPEDKIQEQIILFCRLMMEDLSKFKGKEQEAMYKGVIDRTFTLTEKETCYDIGYHEDKVHTYLVDRLDLA